MNSVATIVLVLFAIAVPTLSQLRELPPAQVEMVNTERAFARMAAERGFRDSFFFYFADDGIAFNPHPFNVRDSLRNRPSSPFGIQWAPVYGDMAQAGDLGWDTGPTLFVDNSPQKKPTRHGMFFSVWKKQSDGNWRVVLDLGADTPAEVVPLSAPFQTSFRKSNKQPATVNVDEEIAGLLKVERDFLATAKSGNVGEAYRKTLSDEARVHRPGVMPVVGKQALRGWAAEQTASLTGEPIKADVSRSGDLGYAYGSYELGGAKPSKGYFARVWKRDAKGAWQIVMDTVEPVPPGK